ncbi:MAG: hypothetical protein AUJ58_11235 [Zetaproteobacteria bacterium CG1_02_55_237]|nr:MAG: hypothetical protein AUJ58_11235 [Zetaproteobacteria bacterium CG1_02_55_237]
MKATIRLINQKRGMYAAEIEDSSEFVIFELLDSSEPEIGDEISHSDFYSMGGETYKNLTQGCVIDVFVENVCGKNLIRQQCFLEQ